MKRKIFALEKNYYKICFVIVQHVKNNLKSHTHLDKIQGCTVHQDYFHLFSLKKM